MHGDRFAITMESSIMIPIAVAYGALLLRLPAAERA
jgi:hypothetical protein